MRGNVDSGHLRIAYINGIPIALSATSKVFPEQEMKNIDLLQGGPRTRVYAKDRKRITGSLDIPLYLDKDGNVAEGCREVIRCGDNPMKLFSLAMNFGVMGRERTALAYQKKWDTSLHRRLTFSCAAVRSLDLTADRNGNVNMKLEFIALPEDDDAKINDYDFNVPYTDLMSRHASFADCIITKEEDTVFMKDVTNFNLNWDNPVEEIYLVPGTPDMSRDYAHYLYLEKGTVIKGSWEEIKRAEEWDNELEAYNHGGYADDDYVRIRIADIMGEIRDPLYDLQEQPLMPGILRKKINFMATFRDGWIEDGSDHNMIFPGI